MNEERPHRVRDRSIMVAVIGGVFALLAAVLPGWLDDDDPPAQDPAPSSAPAVSPAPSAAPTGSPDPSSVPLPTLAVQPGPAVPQVQLSRTIVAPGETVTATGAGFPPSEQVVLTWYPGSGQLELGVVDVAPDGTFSAAIRIPDTMCNTVAGALYVIAQPTYAGIEVPLRVRGAAC